MEFYEQGKIETLDLRAPDERYQLYQFMHQFQGEPNEIMQATDILNDRALSLYVRHVITDSERWEFFLRCRMH